MAESKRLNVVEQLERGAVVLPVRTDTTENAPYPHAGVAPGALSTASSGATASAGAEVSAGAAGAAASAAAAAAAAAAATAAGATGTGTAPGKRRPSLTAALGGASTPPLKAARFDAGAVRAGSVSPAPPLAVSGELVQEAPPVTGAFARLEGRFETNEPLVRFVVTLPCTLGRGHTGHPDNFLSLGAAKSISKQHCVLDYDPECESFTLQVEGKNGVIVQGKFYGAEARPVKLKSKDAIKIGTLCVYFLLPATEKPKESYAELALKIFREMACEGLVLGTKEMVVALEKKYKYFERERGKAATPLMHSLQQAMRRSDYFIKAGMIGSTVTRVVPRAGYLLADDRSDLGARAREAKAEGKEPQTMFAEEEIAAKIAIVLEAQLRGERGPAYVHLTLTNAALTPTVMHLTLTNAALTPTVTPAPICQPTGLEQRQGL